MAALARLCEDYAAPRRVQIEGSPSSRVSRSSVVGVRRTSGWLEGDDLRFTVSRG